jgi:ATP-binding cassette subfamily B protein
MTSEPDDESAPRKRVLTNLQVLRFIAGRWMRRKGLFASSIALMLVSVSADLALPWASGAMVAAVASGTVEGTSAAWGAWAAFVGVYLAFITSRNIAFRHWARFAAANMKDLTDEAFERVMQFSADWHADNFAGATVRKISRAMWGYDNVSDALVLWLGSAFLVLVGLTISMLLRWPAVGLFAAGAVGTYVVLNLMLTSRWVRPLNLVANAKDSAIGAALADTVTGVAAVKGFGAERRELDRFSSVTREWADAALRTWIRWTDAVLIQSMVLVVFQAGLTGLLLWRWSLGEAGPGDVAFAVTAFLLMAGYLRNMGENVQMLQKGLDDVEDVARFLSTPPQVADRADASDFRPGAGEIEFDRVTFGYRNQGRYLYEDFSLRIAPGERVALVGPTGAGKSTFVKLIQRLYDLDGGAIRIDGQDVAAVRQSSLRRAVAVVPQEPILFHRSIAENIAYGRPGATQAEIEEAARRAHAHDFIFRLPKGYETLVGERGVKLSGGERQRVAIARAFLADARILVLDEATSSLDVSTERDVQEATEDLMAGRTTIVIAHRLSTIRGADRILVFSGGQVVEEGRHRDLIARGGSYARLHAVSEGAA